MTPQDFANKIRTKYPGAYDSVDDETLVNKIIEKYPQYKDKVVFETPTDEGAFGTIGGAFSKLGSGIKESFKQRVETGAKEGVEAPTLAQGALRTLGQGAGFVQDVGFEALKFLTPKFIEDLTSKGLKKIGETEVAQEAGSKLSQLQEKYPEAMKDIGAVINIASLIPAGKGLAVAGEQSVKLAPKGVKLGKEAIKTGKEAIETGIEKGKTALSEVPSKIKSKITKTPVIKGEQKIVNDAVEIGREKITPKYQEIAASEQRMFTEGRTKEVKIAPSRRELLVGESIQPLVEQGRINPNALPFENIPEISTEVSRINQGIKNLIQDKKIPFNEKSLRSKLSAVKDDASIIFTTDPTIEKTYDALIETFINEVRNKDTLGLFLARQDFDKIPAVKKLLDGMKGATGENLRRQAVLDIRRAANEYVADLLDARTKSIALKSLAPKEAESLIQKAKSFDNVDDFVREGRETLQNKITDETYRAERRRIQRSLANGETFEQAAAREGISINLEDDLRDIWQIAQSQVDPTTGKLIQDLLKQESYMIEAIGNLSEKSKGLAGSTTVSRFMDSNPTIKALTRQAIPFGLGGIAF